MPTRLIFSFSGLALRSLAACLSARTKTLTVLVVWRLFAVYTLENRWFSQRALYFTVSSSYGFANSAVFVCGEKVITKQKPPIEWIGGFVIVCRRKLVRKLCSALLASSLQNFSTVCCAHSLTKAMFLFSLAFFGLIGSKHCDTPHFQEVFLLRHIIIY